MPTSAKVTKSRGKGTGTTRSKGVVPKRERDRVVARAKAFIKRGGGQKQLLPLLGTSDTFMTPEELAAFRKLG